MSEIGVVKKIKKFAKKECFLFFLRILIIVRCIVR